MCLASRVNPEKEKKKFDVATTLRYYMDVFPEDLEEAVEMLAESGKVRGLQFTDIAGNKRPLIQKENNMQIFKPVLLALSIILLCSPLPALAQDAKSEDIEAARSEMLKRWGVDGLVKPSNVEATAKTILGRPLAEQPDDQLRELAKRANTAANLVGFILEEYEEYYRDNYRYDFVQKKVSPFHDAYVRLSNRLKSYRSQAYFNLGKKAAERGDEMTAFFMFRDAYRMSTFTEDEGDHKGMRYQAEIEMKKLLGLEGMDTFTYWK